MACWSFLTWRVFVALPAIYIVIPVSALCVVVGWLLSVYQNNDKLLLVANKLLLFSVAISVFPILATNLGAFPILVDIYTACLLGLGAMYLIAVIRRHG